MISIVVPIFNIKNYITKCVDSIISQSYRDFELILVDDGSSDGSGKLIDELSKTDNRIRVIHKTNGGLSDARNVGINNELGEFCLLVDEDEYIREDTLELCINNQKEYCSVVVFDMAYVYPDKEVFSSGGNFKCDSYSKNKELIFINNSACNKMYRTVLLKKVPFPKGMLYEDLATIPIVLVMVNSISKINEVLYFYVQRENSIAHNINEKIFDIYKAINRIKDFYNTPNINQLYIKHGLFLTTLKIKDHSKDVIKYLKINNEMLDKYYPSWREIFVF